MDIRKLMKKVPALLAKVKDAKNLDGQVTMADITFVLDLIQVAFEEGVTQVARGGHTGRGSSGEALHFDDFDQMQAYLDEITKNPALGEDGTTAPLSTTQSEAGVVINPSDDEQDQGGQARGSALQWVVVGRFLLTQVAPKIVKALKKNK
jgi:hypothetical protein